MYVMRPNSGHRARNDRWGKAACTLKFIRDSVFDSFDCPPPPHTHTHTVKSHVPGYKHNIINGFIKLMWIDPSRGTFYPETTWPRWRGGTMFSLHGNNKIIITPRRFSNFSSASGDDRCRWKRLFLTTSPLSFMIFFKNRFFFFFLKWFFFILVFFVSVCSLVLKYINYFFF